MSDETADVPHESDLSMADLVDEAIERLFFRLLTPSETIAVQGGNPSYAKWVALGNIRPDTIPPDINALLLALRECLLDICVHGDEKITKALRTERHERERLADRVQALSDLVDEGTESLTQGRERTETAP